MQNNTNLIRNYFPAISDKQQAQFEMLLPIYADWNEKINLISRKDFENFEVHHVLHSLAVAKFIQFNDDATVLDVGTGGGFPGIPLAILFPDVNFILVDSIAKKIKVVNDVVAKLDLQNVKTINGRAEQMQTKVDYVLSRATAPMSDLINWTKPLLTKGTAGTLPNGWIALKGGDLEEELTPFRESVVVKSIADYFEEEFFVTKKVIFLGS